MIIGGWWFTWMLKGFFGDGEELRELDGERA
jgi:hypothetical protein